MSNFTKIEFMTTEIDDNQYPYTAVAYIVSTWDGIAYSGSGALVGKNDVLTASHVIYDSARGGLADDIKIYPSYDPDDGYFQTYYNAVYYNYYPDFDPDGDGFIYTSGYGELAGSELDIALLTLDRDLETTTGFFGMDSSFTSGNVSVVGYPAKYDDQPMYDEGYANKAGSDNYFSVSGLEINPGNSGGPVYYTDAEGPTIVGVVSTPIAITALNAHWDWILEEISSNDSFLPNPTYSVVALYDDVDEGGIASFRVDTTNVSAGAIVPYYLTGIDTDDISKSVLAGKIRIGDNGSGYLNIQVLADQVTEGVEYVSLNVSGESATIKINDTSLDEGMQIRTENYANGDSYTGSFKDGLRHGEGTYTVANGLVYVGEFENGLRNGEGTYTFANGNEYVGEFKNGVRNGEGVFTFANGNVYSGQFENDLRHGLGEYRFNNGDRYVGEFYSDAYQGSGTYTFSFGDRYVGEFYAEKFHGQGTYYFVNGDTIVGEFKNNTMDGQATVRFSSGDSFVGEYEEDIRNGFGTYYYANGGKYSGQWVNGKFTGSIFDSFENASDKIQFTMNAANETFTALANKIKLEIQSRKEDFSIQKNGESWEISGSNIGTDTLDGFKRLEFSNGTLALDIDGGDTAGQAYRLYQAAFARTPDMPGVAYHMNDMESNGLSVTQIAGNFIASPEFKTQYGENPTEDEYVNLLYQNVLGRTSQQFEVDYYKDRFDQGTTDWNTTLVFFAESPENISLVGPDIANGIWLPDA